MAADEAPHSRGRGQPTTVEENRAIATAYVEALVRGDVEEFERLTHDECRFFMPGDEPRWVDKAEFLKEIQVLSHDSPMTMRIGEVLAEGDRVWFELESHTTIPNGKHYNNFYVFQFRVVDRQIIEFKEQCDTLHVWRTLDLPMTYDGPRPSPLTSVTHVISGESLPEKVRDRN